MKFIKNTGLILLFFLVYHLMVTGFVSFIYWENMVTLSFEYYDKAARSSYLMILIGLMFFISGFMLRVKND